MSSGSNPNSYSNNQYRAPGNGSHPYSQNRYGNHPNQSNRYPYHSDQGNRYSDGRGANSPYANNPYQGAQYPKSQKPNTRYPNNQYPNGQNPSARYPEYHDNRYPQKQYHQNSYPHDTYPDSGYTNPRYRTSRQSAGHHPGGYGPNIQAGRPGGGMMNGATRAAEHASRVKIIALLSAILVTLGTISTILYNAFLKTGTPQDTLAKFEQAIEKLDQTSYIECFDHQSQKLYSGIVSLAGSVSGWNISGLLDTAEGLGGIMGAVGLAPQVDIDIKDIKYEGDDRCKVYTTMRIQYSMPDFYGAGTDDMYGMDETDDVVFPMVLEGREWKIDLSAMATDDANLTNSLFGM